MEIYKITEANEKVVKGLKDARQWAEGLLARMERADRGEG